MQLERHSKNQKTSWAIASASFLAVFCLPVTNCYSTEYPHFLSGKRIPQESEVGLQPVSIITEEMIRLSGARNLAEVFRMVPGFTVGYLYGNQPTVITRSNVSELNRRIQMRIDGRSIYLPMTGGAFFRNIPVQLEDIDHIEISRGPSSSINGGNALLATIDIYTKTPFSDSVHIFSVRKGSNDITDTSIQTNVGLNDGSHMIASFKSREDDGLIDLHDHSRDKALWLKVDSQLSADNDIQIQLGVSQSNYGAGGEDPVLDPKRPLDQERLYLQGNWHHSFGKNWTSTSILSYESFNYGHEINSEHPIYGPFNVDYNFETERYSLEHYHNLTGENYQIAIGGLIDHDLYHSEGRLDSSYYGHLSNTNLQAFGQAAWYVDAKNRINAGVNLQKSDINNEVHFAPQFSYIFQPLPNHFFRVGYSEGYRLPSGYENAGQTKYYLKALKRNLYSFKSTAHLSGNLDSESIQEHSLGYAYSNRKANVSFEALAYKAELNNVIEQWIRHDPAQAGTPVEYVVDYTNNTAQIDIQGLELELTWEPTMKWFLHGTMAFTNVKGESVSRIDYPNSHPDWIASLLIGYNIKPNWTAALNFHAVDNAIWSRGYVMDGYKKLDFSTEYCNHRLRDNELCLQFTAQNLLEDVRDARREHGWGQNYFITLEYRR
ncbi:TonB-dependent receptor plug domain-containing protein [Neptuniibacter sp. QD37_11]|uniref:TonB-dependent receptor plug domain-containing protein n=1 Tax=Neptuniibacter sp. QD37_11 TaxID=3398209 RepID=UPI0039F55244